MAGALAVGARELCSRGPRCRPPKQTVVVIKPGIGLRGIADTLASAGVIKNADLFFWGVRLRRTNEKLKAGEYAIPAYASMADIMDILIAGKSIPHKITAAEGLTSDMIAKIVNADSVLQGDPVATPAEGTLLPETYLFMRGDTRASIVDRMKAAQKKLIARLWPKRDKNLPYTTIAEAITLASIVEKETSLPSERRHIAAIFVNRLRTGMKLQSDPTIIYSITGGYPLGRGIRASELARITPYNSYAVAGLPPTPICNPGKDAIAAVLNPGASKDLFFVASGTGGHVFSASVADQNKHVAELRERERIQKLHTAPVHATVAASLGFARCARGSIVGLSGVAMTIASMTGFAEAHGSRDGARWRWEVKSVNGRGLDVRLRYPPGFDGIEPPARMLAGERFKRGSLQAALTFETADSARGLRVDAAALASAVRIAKEVAAETGMTPARIDGLLALKGVIVQEDAIQLDDRERGVRDAAILETLATALDALARARANEGNKLLNLLTDQMDEIEKLTNEAAILAATQPAALRQKLSQQIKDVLQGTAINEDRLTQEVALLAVKADVREELDRLAAHVQEARALLASGEAVGRKLDFLSQEFNREANTLCSKSSDIALTRVGLALKAMIDQFREQAQNVE